ncbi:hypothetical protein [Nocardiopsis quinghaiensis]|uniref:hypothetical protein n=1 Tax=Nocardiopsis quinghaiensis TaxID=464995 RepID=UPI0012385310|nr:hypothetical protein [Nocardiopsis quinghaiensis]
MTLSQNDDEQEQAPDRRDSEQTPPCSNGAADAHTADDDDPPSADSTVGSSPTPRTEPDHSPPPNGAPTPATGGGANASCDFAGKAPRNGHHLTQNVLYLFFGQLSPGKRALFASFLFILVLGALFACLAIMAWVVVTAAEKSGVDPLVITAGWASGTLFASLFWRWGRSSKSTGAPKDPAEAVQEGPPGGEEDGENDQQEEGG